MAARPWPISMLAADLVAEAMREAIFVKQPTFDKYRFCYYRAVAGVDRHGEYLAFCDCGWCLAYLGNAPRAIAEVRSHGDWHERSAGVL